MRVRVPLTLGETVYGPMVWLPLEMFVGRSFERYGEYSIGESRLFQHLLNLGDTAVDVGANIGAHTIPMAKVCQQVIAFEPQRIVIDILKMNCALNDCTNVEVVPCGLGDVRSIERFPVFNFNSASNVGGASPIDISTHPGITTYPVSFVPLDDWLLGRAVNFMKIDAEGSEEIVLRGARETLAKHHPALYIENDRREKSPGLVAEIYRNGYRAFWHTVPLFNPENMVGDPMNVFEIIRDGTKIKLTSIDLLCFHESDTRYDTSQLIECPPDNPEFQGLANEITTKLPGVLDVPKAVVSPMAGAMP